MLNLDKRGNFLAFLGFGPRMAGCSVTLCKLFLKYKYATVDYPTWKNDGTFDPQKSWLQRHRPAEKIRRSHIMSNLGAYTAKVTLRCEPTFEEIYASKSFDVFFEEWVNVVWPYPPEQLEWVNETVDRLSAIHKTLVSPISHFGFRCKSDVTDEEAKRAVTIRGFFCIRGQVFSRFRDEIADIDALFVFVQSLARKAVKYKLPPPPEPFPSIW